MRQLIAVTRALYKIKLKTRTVTVQYGSQVKVERRERMYETYLSNLMSDGRDFVCLVGEFKFHFRLALLGQSKLLVFPCSVYLDSLMQHFLSQTSTHNTTTSSAQLDAIKLNNNMDIKWKLTERNKCKELKTLPFKHESKTQVIKSQQNISWTCRKINLINHQFFCLLNYQLCLWHNSQQTQVINVTLSE